MFRTAFLCVFVNFGFEDILLKLFRNLLTLFLTFFSFFIRYSGWECSVFSNIHNVLRNSAFVVSDHGSAAEVVRMVEVEGWRRVGCRLGPKYLSIFFICYYKFSNYTVILQAGF